MPLYSIIILKSSLLGVYTHFKRVKLRQHDLLICLIRADDFNLNA